MHTRPELVPGADGETRRKGTRQTRGPRNFGQQVDRAPAAMDDSHYRSIGEFDPGESWMCRPRKDGTWEDSREIP